MDCKCVQKKSKGLWLIIVAENYFLLMRFRISLKKNVGTRNSIINFIFRTDLHQDISRGFGFSRFLRDLYLLLCSFGLKYQFCDRAIYYCLCIANLYGCFEGNLSWKELNDWILNSPSHMGLQQLKNPFNINLKDKMPIMDDNHYKRLRWKNKRTARGSPNHKLKKQQKVASCCLEM